MTLRDGWATASVRIVGADLTAAALPEHLLNAGRLNKEGTVLSIRPSLPEDSDLAAHLVAVEALLARERETLAGLGEVRIDVFIGWSPRAPQDGITVSNELVRLMNSVGARMVVNTYAD